LDEMTNLPFDRAVDYYDGTRELPGTLASHGIQALLDRLQTRPHTTLLEVGAGTGRIGIPLLQRGANLFGCDLSRPMLLRHQSKYPPARLAQADAVYLPYPTDHFDGLITIHVLHLVGAWRAALREFARVLRPGGVYINSWNWHSEEDVGNRVREFWRRRVEALGADWRRPGIQSREELLDEAHAMGAETVELEAGRTTLPVSPQDVIDNIASRVFSDTWPVPDNVFAASLDDLRAWAAEQFSDLTAAQTVERRLLLDVIQFR
jgi:ubiquinone/menaquinone biosynthesis C-methylase UbiE